MTKSRYTGIAFALLIVAAALVTFEPRGTVRAQSSGGHRVTSATDVVTLFGTLGSGTKYLGDDGTLHTASTGTGTVNAGDGVFDAASPTAGALVVNTQTGNCVFASPSSGSSGNPLCRTLVAADIPTQIGCPSGGTTAGTAAAQTLTVPNIHATATTGDCISFIAGFTGTASTTLTVTPTGGSAWTTVNLYRRIFNGVAALGVADEIASSPYQAMYDGTEWVLMTTSSTVYNAGTLGSTNCITGNSANNIQANANCKVSAGGVIKTTNSVILTSDTSGITATTPGTATTVFTFPALTISTNYSFHCSGTTTQATAGGGIGIAILTSTTAATQMEAHALVNTSATAINGQSSGNLSTTTESAIYTGVTGTLTTQLPWTIDGSIEVGGTAPATFVIGFFSASASDAVVVKRDSYCSLAP